MSAPNILTLIVYLPTAANQVLRYAYFEALTFASLNARPLVLHARMQRDIISKIQTHSAPSAHRIQLHPIFQRFNLVSQ